MQIFLVPSPYIVEKLFLLENIRNKCLIRKTNLYFFDDMKTGQIFPSKVCRFQYNHRFFLSRKWETLEHLVRQVCKNVLSLDCQDSIHFGMFQVA